MYLANQNDLFIAWNVSILHIDHRELKLPNRLMVAEPFAEIIAH